MQLMEVRGHIRQSGQAICGKVRVFCVLQVVLNDADLQKPEARLLMHMRRPELHRLSFGGQAKPGLTPTCTCTCTWALMPGFV